MDDLVRWLGEQLAKDERVAQACPGGGRGWDADGIAFYARDLNPEAQAHIVEHDPARVLREIDAKRRIIAEHPVDGWRCATCADPEDFDEDVDGDREWSRHGKYYPCPTLRLLALPYADRPGYREDWRP